MGRSRNSRSRLVGVQHGSATSEDSLAASHKTKHTLTIQSISHTLWCLPTGDKKLTSTQSLHMDVYSSFMHNWQNFDATKLSFSRWLGHQEWYLQTMEYYSVPKRTIKPRDCVEEPQVYNAQWEKQAWKHHVLYDSNCLIKRSAVTTDSGGGQRVE